MLSQSQGPLPDSQFILDNLPPSRPVALSTSTKAGKAAAAAANKKAGKAVAAAASKKRKGGNETGAATAKKKRGPSKKKSVEAQAEASKNTGE
jgi:hypothetical protein